MTKRQEVAVRLHAPLRGARLIDPGAPLPTPPAVDQVGNALCGVPERVSPEPEPPAAPPAPEPREQTPVPASEPAPAPSFDEQVARQLDEERTRIEQALAAISAGVGELHENRVQERQQWRRTAVELALTLATRLLHDNIVAGDFPIETLVRELIGQVDAGPVVITLNPEDLVLLQKRLDGRPLSERPEGLSYVADPALPRGDCRVETGDAVALAQLDVQLTEMRRRLLRSLGHAQS